MVYLTANWSWLTATMLIETSALSLSEIATVTDEDGNIKNPEYI